MLLARCGSLDAEASAAAALYVFGELTARFQRKFSRFAARNRRFGLIDRREKFGASTLALFPQQKGFLDCVLFARNPAALDRLTDKRLLVGREVYFHISKGKNRHPQCQVVSQSAPAKEWTPPWSTDTMPR
jgi:hypothetical protein